MSAGSDRGPSEAFLAMGDGGVVSIAGEGQLKEALKALPLLLPGQTASLFRGPKHYVRATRRGDYWSAARRRGGWWTLAAFTAETTSEHSERQVRQGRAAGSLRKRLVLMFRSAPPETQLSTDQVRTIFTEFLLGRKFTIPLAGA